MRVGSYSFVRGEPGQRAPRVEKLFQMVEGYQDLRLAVGVGDHLVLLEDEDESAGCDDPRLEVLWLRLQPFQKGWALAERMVLPELLRVLMLKVFGAQV